MPLSYAKKGYANDATGIGKEDASGEINRPKDRPFRANKPNYREAENARERRHIVPVAESQPERPAKTNQLDFRKKDPISEPEKPALTRIHSFTAAANSAFGLAMFLVRGDPPDPSMPLVEIESRAFASMYDKERRRNLDDPNNVGKYKRSSTTCVGAALLSGTLSKIRHPPRPLPVWSIRPKFIQNQYFLPEDPANDWFDDVPAEESFLPSPAKRKDDQEAADKATAAAAREKEEKAKIEREVREKMAADEKIRRDAEAVRFAAEIEAQRQKEQAELYGNSSDDKGEVDPTVDEISTAQMLFTHCQNNKAKRMDEMFKNGVSTDLVDRHGNTCLHIACQNGSKKIIRLLQRRGANLNIQNKQGQTALHYCFAYQFDSYASFLIKQGANDTLVNMHGLTCYEGLKPADKDG